MLWPLSAQEVTRVSVFSREAEEPGEAFSEPGGQQEGALSTDRRCDLELVLPSPDLSSFYTVLGL